MIWRSGSGAARSSISWAGPLSLLFAMAFSLPRFATLFAVSKVHGWCKLCVTLLLFGLF